MRPVIAGFGLAFMTLLALPGAIAFAAEKHAAFNDPAAAGPDFLVQGEYHGTLANGAVIAAQVVALGNGKFDGVLYSGGLPGSGWDDVTRFHFKGETAGGETRITGIHGERLMFENADLQATIRDEVFRGRADMFRNLSADASFEMRKVHRRSPTLGAKPPPGAIVLFDGSSTGEWVEGQIVEGGLLDVGTETKRRFSSLRFHLEFRTPFMPTAEGMARGNSGVYINKAWEIQVLDSFGWNDSNRKFVRLADFGRCGGIHEMIGPRINMSFPPLLWQTYDVEFVAARFDRTGARVSPAIMTVRHNGVLIHDRVILPAAPPEANASDPKYREPGPLLLQKHGNPVRFRNIWAVEMR